LEGYTSVEMWLDALVGCGVGEGFQLDAYAVALDTLARGVPIGLACEGAGLSTAQVSKMRQTRPQIDQLFVQARALAARPLVEKVMRSEDWRAAAWMLERNVGKEEFRQDRVQQDKLVIEINVSRDQAIAAKHGVVDVTPEVLDGQQMVPGLPAKP
jgi:hypothetical protein